MQQVMKKTVGRFLVAAAMGTLVGLTAAQGRAASDTDLRDLANRKVTWRGPDVDGATIPLITVR